MGRKSRTAAFVALFRALRSSSHPGEPGVGDRLRAVPRLVSATLSGRYAGTTRGQLGLLAMAVLYVVSPIDLVPEAFIPFLGFADDAFVITWIAGRLLGETEAFLRWERAEPRSRTRDDVVQGDVIR